VRGYEFTDRGKIAVALFLVIILLVVPATIIAFNAIAKEPSSPLDDQSVKTDEPPPPISESPTTEETDNPPPNEGGVFGQPTISPPNSDNNTMAPDPPISQPPPVSQDPPVSQGSDQPSETVPGYDTEFVDNLSFIFSPGSQDALDDRTLSNLDSFLSSQKNEQNYLIAVETPKLADEEVARIMTVIGSVFAEKGVNEQMLTHVTLPWGVPGESITVSLYYLPRNPINEK
jgi:hypothetical protein